MQPTNPTSMTPPRSAAPVEREKLLAWLKAEYAIAERVGLLAEASAYKLLAAKIRNGDFDTTPTARKPRGKGGR